MLWKFTFSALEGIESDLTAPWVSGRGVPVVPRDRVSLAWPEWAGNLVEVCG
ncbi:MAG: hypothetical protein ABDI20_01255 [Candidatus Bipolaricaulaceae bacterium]